MMATLQTVTMFHSYKNRDYLINLIDTPVRENNSERVVLYER
jgi:translation elongation factor EF-4